MSDSNQFSQFDLGGKEFSSQQDMNRGFQSQPNMNQGFQSQPNMNQGFAQQNMNQGFNPQMQYGNPYIKYGDGEMEYVMSVKDVFMYLLISMIPIYNIYFMIKIIIGPTSRTNKTVTNMMRAGLLFSLVIFAIMFVLGIFGSILVALATLGG